MTRTPLTTTLDGYEVWFVTGSQNLYGEETLRQVAEQSQAVADGLGGLPVKVVWKPVLKDSDSIRRLALEVNARDDVIGVIAWMHTFSPAKMWIAGLDALQKPLLHLHTQANVELPWADIDFDFMNLNQAAHGDREFGYIQTRLGVARKTVVGHVSNPAVVASRSRTGSAPPPAGRHPARSSSPASATTCATSPSPRATRPRPSCGSACRSTRGASTSSSRRWTPASDADVDALVAEYVELYDVAAELRPGGERHQSLRDGAAIELGLRSFLEEGGFGAFTTSFEDLGALKQLPGLAVQRLMAEGYGFGAEGDWKTAILVRVANVMGAGFPAARASWRTTPTTSCPATSASSARTCSRSRPRSPPRSRASRCTRSASAARRTRCAWSSPPTRARARRGRDERHARPLPAGRERRRERRGARPAEAARRPRGLEARSPTSRRAPRAGWPPAPRTTPS